MDSTLTVSIGHCSDSGPKHFNQDFHGAVIPHGSQLTLKGVAVAIADGISSSPVSHVAAETAVKSFLADYYCTSETMSVRSAGVSVITAANGWLHAETQRSHAAYDRDRGYVCTFSALIIKGRLLHLFHVGDSRISRVAGDTLEPLTQDHCVVLSASESYLGRALGMAPALDIDYDCHPLTEGDLLLLTTDGVHEFLSPRELTALLRGGDNLDAIARQIVERALANGSNDNLTVQIVRVDRLPDGDAVDYTAQSEALPPPPPLEPPATFEGYRLLRQIHASDRSHIYFAIDSESESGTPVALKIPAMNLRQEPLLLRQFMLEEWIARRVSSPHLLKAHLSLRPRQYLYTVMEHVEGQTLRQWMHDHPRPSLASVRELLEQMIKGVRTLHRKEMVHGDLRPENILIDGNGTLKIIDFGSVRVAGLDEAAARPLANDILGTVQYTAPEWLAGEQPSWRCDQFSIAVIAYEMLTGSLPYGASAARVRTTTQQHALRYITAHTPGSAIPDWIDGALRRAAHPDPRKRYDALSEFIGDLQVPNRQFQLAHRAPLLERDPVLFWKGLSLLLGAGLLVLLFLHLR